MINYHLLVAGRVQGVGFRWATLEIANELGLVGWVKNRAKSRSMVFNDPLMHSVEP